MKKNDWSIIISVLLYSILFYKQSAGINFFIFNISIIGLLLFRNQALLKSTVWLSVAFGALLSSFFIYQYGSALAIVANMFSLFILSALSIDTRTSFLTSLFLTICSTGSSCVFMFIDWVNRKSKHIEGAYKRPFYVKLFLIVIPFLIALLFFFFYQTANPLFYNFTKDINLDFISFAWICFTISGLLLMYGFFHNQKMKSVVNIDANAAISLTPEIASRKNFLNGLMRLDTETISGIVLFSMLNILLLFVNVLDVHFLWFDGKLPKGVDHKAFVHDGIGTLITSIIVAIIIILFYFRGELNFYKKSKGIKLMTYIWIIQNIFMILSTAFRNEMYIDESGISYKKIGVYVYLILALVGLATTFIKVWKVKTNWYLFRVNAAVYFYFLVLSCVFNWDVIITDFNIKKHDVEHKKLEKYLLLDLSYKNLPQLLSLSDTVANADDYKARDYYNFSRGVYYYNFKSGLAEKLYDFMDDYSKLDWQSTCAEKTRVYHQLLEMKDVVDTLRFENKYLQTLKPLQPFTNLRALEITNGNLTDLSELKSFTKLEKLTLSNCQIDTLLQLPHLIALRELNISSNNINDLKPLRYLTNLETLDISGRNYILDYSPLLNLIKLKHLIIGGITETDLEILNRHFPNVKIDANIISAYQPRE